MLKKTKVAVIQFACFLICIVVVFQGVNAVLSHLADLVY